MVKAWGDDDIDRLPSSHRGTGQHVDRPGAESRAVGCLVLGDVRKERQDGVRPGVGHLVTSRQVRDVVACGIVLGQ
jgi:hypothetical protein